MQKTPTRVLNPALKVIRDNWDGNILLGSEFSNSLEYEKPLGIEILKWKLGKNPQIQEKRDDPFSLKTIKGDGFLRGTDDVIVWLGHSSFYVRLNGTSFIIDPIFYDLPGIKRLAPPPCEISSFKAIDYLLLSHSHRDHADKKTLKGLLKSSPNCIGLLPLNMGKWYGKLSKNYQEAAWWQQYSTGEDVSVYFMPAKHWSRRWLNDYNRVLWGSFIIQGNGKTIYYAGDTGWCRHFNEIAKFFPNIDYALLPIGAYKPPEIMKREHISPNETVIASNELRAKNFIPMHYGTYDLSDEPLGEPLRILKQNGNLNANLLVCSVGESVPVV